jgi:hypothetical protein
MVSQSDGSAGSVEFGWLKKGERHETKTAAGILFHHRIVNSRAIDIPSMRMKATFTVEYQADNGDRGRYLLAVIMQRFDGYAAHASAHA